VARFPAVLLGVVTELTGRHSSDSLAVSAGNERVGLAGWIIDRVVGVETDIGGDTAKIGIAELLERELISLNMSRRLEATGSGMYLWDQLKPA
jgi:hypothetical protein